MGLGLAHPPDVQGADRLAVDQQRDDDHRLRLDRRTGTWTERGSVGVVGEHGLAVVDDPAGDARSQRALVGKDLVGEAVAGEDGSTDRRAAWSTRYTVRESYGTMALSESAMRSRTPAGIQGRQESLVDVEETALALQLVLQLDLLAMEPLDVLGVDERLDRGGREDRQRDLIVVVEPVAARGRHDDDALDDLALEHRHDQASTPVGRSPRTRLRGSSRASSRRSGRPCSATQPVRPVPIGIAAPPSAGVVVPRIVPSNASASQVPVSWSTR